MNEMLEELKNKENTKRRSKIVELLNESMMYPYTEDLERVSGKSKDAVEDAIMQYKDIQLLINAKRYNSDYDYEELLEKKNKIIDSLCEEKEIVKK